jgi:predicted rRNA methylase YqxC with S4 and FtsJ domains
VIKNICEVLVEMNFFDTLRKAQAAVKRGDIYVNNIRVANADALLVIVEYVYIKHIHDGRIAKGKWVAHNYNGTI